MNKLIQSMPYQPRKHVSIEREPNDIVVIEGIRYQGDFFRMLADPDPNVVYRIRREDDAVFFEVIEPEVPNA
jgi:hypothetical protein